MLHCMIEDNKNNIKPRIFVSSVVKGFEEFREAARQAIENAGCEPILVNEDYPAIVDSSRNACLDAIESADILIIIISERGGYKTPSGKLVIEEEYLYAKKLKLPILVFLQKVERDKDAKKIANDLSNYVDGIYRKIFNDKLELKREVEVALNSLISHIKKSIMDKTKIGQHFQEPYEIQNEASIRFVLAPERKEEVIDPVTLESDNFLNQVYGVGHSNNIKLFNYKYGKKRTLNNSSLIIHQKESENAREPNEEVRLEINESGLIIIDSNITGRVVRDEEYNMQMYDSYFVIIEDIENVVDSFLRFVGAFYDELDKYKRHHRFYYNIAIVNLGDRKIAQQYERKTSFAINSFRENLPLVAFEEPRLTSRVDLNNPEEEIKRILALFVRMVN